MSRKNKKSGLEQLLDVGLLWRANRARILGTSGFVFILLIYDFLITNDLSLTLRLAGVGPWWNKTGYVAMWLLNIMLWLGLLALCFKPLERVVEWIRKLALSGFSITVMVGTSGFTAIATGFFIAWMQVGNAEAIAIMGNIIVTVYALAAITFLYFIVLLVRDAVDTSTPHQPYVTCLLGLNRFMQFMLLALFTILLVIAGISAT